MHSASVVKITVGDDQVHSPKKPRKKKKNLQDLDKMIRDTEKQLVLHEKLQKGVKKSQVPTVQEKWGKCKEYSDSTERMCSSYEDLAFNVSSALMYSARDLGCRVIHESIHKSLQEIQLGFSVSEPIYSSDPADEEGQRFLKEWEPFPKDILDNFYEIQRKVSNCEREITEVIGKLENANKQASSMKDPIEYIGPSIIQVIERRQDIVRRLLESKKRTTEENQKTRMRTVLGIMATVEDVIKAFQEDLSDIIIFYKEFTVKIEDIRVMKNGGKQNEFMVELESTITDYNNWLKNVVSKTIPDAIDVTSGVPQFIQQCDAQNDECGVRRVRSMLSQIERVLTALSIKEQTKTPHVNGEASVFHTLKKESEMVTSQWNAVEEELKAIANALDDLSRQRVSFWSKRNAHSSIQALASIENRQKELEKQQAQLHQKSESLRKELGGIREKMQQHQVASDYHKLLNALTHAKTWKKRLEDLYKRTEEESSKRSEHGTEHQMRSTLFHETSIHLRNLYNAAIEKIDGACTLMATSASDTIIARNGQLCSTLRSLEDEWSLTENTLSQYSLRVSSNQLFSDLLGEYRRIECNLREAEDKNFCIQMMSETIKSVIAVRDEYRQFKKKFQNS